MNREGRESKEVSISLMLVVTPGPGLLIVFIILLETSVGRVSVPCVGSRPKRETTTPAKRQRPLDL